MHYVSPLSIPSIHGYRRAALTTWAVSDRGGAGRPPGARPGGRDCVAGVCEVRGEAQGAKGRGAAIDARQGHVRYRPRLRYHFPPDNALMLNGSHVPICNALPSMIKVPLPGFQYETRTRRYIELMRDQSLGEKSMALSKVNICHPCLREPEMLHAPQPPLHIEMSRLWQKCRFPSLSGIIIWSHPPCRIFSPTQGPREPSHTW